MTDSRQENVYGNPDLCEGADHVRQFMSQPRLAHALLSSLEHVLAAQDQLSAIDGE